MQRSQVVLYNLSKQAQKDGFRFDRLYRHLYNEDFYKEALERVRAPVPDWSPETLVAALRDESYRPDPAFPFEDRLVVEVCRMLLEAVYFPGKSYDVRNESGCQRALTAVRQTFTDFRWWLIGTLPDVDDHQLVRLLRQRIQDEKFIRLLWKLLKAGAGRLADESTLDERGSFATLLTDVYWRTFDEDVASAQSSRYVRHAAHFVVGVHGNRRDADGVSATLSTQARGVSVHLVRSERQIVFLGYGLHLGPDKRVHVRVPQGALERFIVERALVVDIDAKPWRMRSRPELLRLADAAIVATYNRELRAFEGSYRFAENISVKMAQLHHVMEYSCLKTLAHKHKTTVADRKATYRQGNRWGVRTDGHTVLFGRDS